MMDDLTSETVRAPDGEILPPEQEPCRHGDIVCLCCGRPQFAMDEDGCGICEECIAA
jgi:hypothetical protein